MTFSLDHMVGVGSFLALTAELEWPSVGRTVFSLIAIVFLLILNAFFVASEFAIVKVRRSQLDALESGNKKRIRTARKVIDNLDGYLSANQLGITLASIALGSVGEPFVSVVMEKCFIAVGLAGVFENLADVLEWIDRLFGSDVINRATIVHTLAFLLSYMVITYLHVVLGELLPKSVAIRKPLDTTLLLSRPLDIFYKVFRAAIWLLNSNANWILKRFGIDPVSEGEHVHSAEELALLVTESERSQEVTETEREILINALELNDLFVRDVMTPRSDVVALGIDTSFEENLDIALESKHTRFPLVKGHLDESVGLIHIKDMLKLTREDEPKLSAIKRELKVVPETMPLDMLLKFFLKEKAHLALVVDEFGAPAGLVFMDNIMEELVGDIQDEFDSEVSLFTKISDGEYVVDGGLTLNDLSYELEELDLEGGDVTTVGGYITQTLGRFPEPGEQLIVKGYQITVTSVDDRRVAQAKFQKLPKDYNEDAETGKNLTSDVEGG